MALDRLVSVRDYADFARTYAGIGKASAARLSDGRRQLVHLTIAGVDDIPILQTSDLYRNLVASLEAYGDPHLPIQVCTRKVRLLVLSAAVALLPDYAFEFGRAEDSRRAARAFRLRHARSGTERLPQRGRRRRPQRRGRRLRRFPGLRFDRRRCRRRDARRRSATRSRVHPHVLAERATLDPTFDPAASDDPCQQVLPAELVYLTPAIPDTLILTEVGP